MGLSNSLSLLLLNLLLMSLDLSVFFLLTRVAARAWPLKPLLAFDHAGKPLVDLLVELFDRVVKPRSGRIREGAKLAFCLATATLARLFIGALFLTGRSS